MSKNEHSDRVRSLFTIIQGKDVVLRNELIAFSGFISSHEPDRHFTFAFFIAKFPKHSL